MGRRHTMPTEEQSSTRSHQGVPQGGGVELSLDELAKGLATGTLSRGKALRLMGAALVGGTLASIPGIAWAKPKGFRTRFSDYPFVTPTPSANGFTINHDQNRGRIYLENSVLKLEFGYKAEAQTHYNQSGGDLYQYFDKRFDPNTNIIAVWDGGTGGTGGYASGAGGIGSTQIYATTDIGLITGANYQFSHSDNDMEGKLVSAPTIETLADQSVRLTFEFSVAGWYKVKKTWVVKPSGHINLTQNWTILKSGWFSEPAIRNQVNPVFTTVSRWGHMWGNNIAGAPGTNSRLNPVNKWYDWSPDKSSRATCNGQGTGITQDAIHADYNRWHGGTNYDFWFWPYNNGLGFEGLGMYRIGYQAFGQSFGSTANEICYHARARVGDGANAYNLGIFAWWGGNGAAADRFKPLSAGTTWTDSYQMEVRAPGNNFPPDQP